MRGRPKNLHATVRKELKLPEMLIYEVDLLLGTNFRGKVPYGEWNKLVERLLRRWLEEQANTGIDSGGNFPDNNLSLPPLTE
jgi:hypothetical protein